MGEAWEKRAEKKFGPKEGRKKPGVNYIARNFVVYNIHLIYYGHSVKKNDMGGAFSTQGELNSIKISSEAVRV
jgi:hypothetical protein